MTPDVRIQPTMSTTYSQSLRGVPTQASTRCSCVLIASSTRHSPRKMRKSILQFAKRLWSSEDPVNNRRALCTNCKSDPVTRSTLCKKCCRRSTVCNNCYTRVLSLHHARLDRYGSLDQCSECDLGVEYTVSYITPILTPPRVVDTITSPRTENLSPQNKARTHPLQQSKSYSSSDSEYQSCSENVDPSSPDLLDSQIILPKISDNCKTVSDCKVVRLIDSNKRYRMSARPAMTRWNTIEEDEGAPLRTIMIKRDSMDDKGLIKPDVLLPGVHCDKENRRKRNSEPAMKQCPPALNFTRSCSLNSGTDRRHNNPGRRPSERRYGSAGTVQRRHNSLGSLSDEKKRHGSALSVDRRITETADTRKRTVRIAEEENVEYSRPCSLELQHVTLGEVTPTVYIKDKNHIVDESIQKSEYVLKRSLSVSNSRLQRKLSKRLAPKPERSAPPSEDAPFLRRNRSSSSVDKASPPPDLLMLTNSGMKLDDIQALGCVYLHKLENQMRNIDSLKEIEKQRNISCRERLKLALDSHEQLAVGLNLVKKQLKECMENYRFISETFV